MIITRGRYPLAADWRHNAKLGKVGANGIDHRAPLTNEQVPRATKYQATLLLHRLGLNKPHIGSGFTDRLGVSRIILLPLDVEFDIGPAASGGPSMPTRHAGSFSKQVRT